jgi:hypothetical protein
MFMTADEAAADEKEAADGGVFLFPPDTWLRTTLYRAARCPVNRIKGGWLTGARQFCKAV